jgi:hypothetical protein
MMIFQSTKSKKSLLKSEFRKKVVYLRKISDTKNVNNMDFCGDKITHSIENAVSGDSFPTEISLLGKNDLSQITKKNGWSFNWASEYRNPNKDVYKLTIAQNPTVIQGLISISIESYHVFMHLLESAPFNIGKNKIYNGVPGNLIAYACRIRF